METLSKTEQEHVERMSEPFAESSPQQNFESWAKRVISGAKKEEKEEKSGPREIKLAGRPEEEREFIEKVAQKDESKDSAKESRRESAAEKEPDAKAGEKPATSKSDDSPSEPLSGDRHWQAVEGKVVLNEKETKDHWSHVNSRVGIALQYMNQHADKTKMEQGFRAIFADKPPAWKDAVMPHLFTALAEVPNPGEVFHRLTLQDREVIRSAKNWKELRAAIHAVSKAVSASQASPKPRAPKPPSEVGGRGAAADDGTRAADGFTDFSERMQRRYAR